MRDVELHFGIEAVYIRHRLTRKERQAREKEMKNGSS